MAKRWHQTLVIILCVVILSICQSSAVPRRRILRPTGAVMKPGRNPGGVPVGQFRSYKQQKPQIPSMGTQFVRNVQVRCIHQSLHVAFILLLQIMRCRVNNLNEIACTISTDYH